MWKAGKRIWKAWEKPIKSNKLAQYSLPIENL